MNERTRVGDVVQIKEQLSRGTWKLGRIEELHKSTDGQYRTGTLRLTGSKGLIAVGDL